jgi:alkylhydroperoxidase family enzyme
MSLVPYADPEKLPEEVRDALARAPVQLNIFKMMANAESCFVPFTRLGAAILGRQKLDARLREMAILLAMRIEGGEYEWIQHVPIAMAEGATQEQIDAIAEGGIESPCFSDLERTALRFTREVVDKVRADEATVRELMKILSAREIVELIMTIGFYMTAARITETTRTDLDPPSGTRVIDQIRREG